MWKLFCSHIIYYLIHRNSNHIHKFIIIKILGVGAFKVLGQEKMYLVRKKRRIRVYLTQLCKFSGMHGDCRQ